VREELGAEVLVHCPIAAPDAAADEALGDVVEPLDENSVFVARVHPRTRAREGARLELVVDTKRLHFFEPETGLAL